jgi:dienelactone hydrolase
METNRNLSPKEMFYRIALEHKPLFRFEGENKKDFEKWKATALPEAIKTLGDFPERVPLNPELMAEWEHDGLIKQRWMIDVGRHISAAFLINKPKKIPKGKKLPAILCWHGHGKFGKEPVMGNDSSEEMRNDIVKMNYNYGHKMAKEGFITFAIDWIGAGERNDSNKPHFSAVNAGRDWCNLYYLNATILGMTSLSINIAHGMAAADFACTFPEVDAEKLGVMGLSGGGTMTLWTALCDNRIKAAEIICYSDLWAIIGFRDYSICGMQVAPGLFKLVDLPDLQGLLAPKPLIIDIGVYDTCFNVDGAMQCFEQVKRIYSAAGAFDNLELDLFPGEHAWGANKSAEFFRKSLQ